MRPENTPPNFSAKEQIIYGIATSLHLFNNIQLLRSLYFHGVHLYLQAIAFRLSKKYYIIHYDKPKKLFQSFICCRCDCSTQLVGKSQ